MTLQAIELSSSYRLINHGPTAIISAKHHGIENAMSASWVCALDFSPARVMMVMDKNAYTRSLVEQSGHFAIQVPFAYQAKQVIALGQSFKNNPTKLADNGVELFYFNGFDIPVVQGCAAYLLCKLIPEAHNQQTYDLLIGEVIGAFADSRVFQDGRWLFDEVSDDLKTLHYVAGGQFYLTGKGLKIGE